MRRLSFLALVLIPLILAGCVAPVEVSRMSVSEPICPTCAPNPQFVNAITVGTVLAEEGSDRIWAAPPYAIVTEEMLREALELSLKNNRLLSNDAAGSEFVLDAMIVEFERSPGLTVNVVSIIRYVMHKRKTESIIRDDLINTGHSANMSHGYLPDKRFAFATEEAIRKSISEFISRLVTGFKPYDVDAGGAEIQNESDDTN